VPVSRKIDEFDRALLSLLQDNALLTAEELAEQVALSPSAIARRLRRLRSTGAIVASRAVLAESVEPLLAALIEVVLSRHEVSEVAGLIRKLEASPAVQLVVEVSGAVDIVLLVVAPDIAGFNAFADAELADHPAVARYETRFVKRRHKFNTAIPLAAKDTE
jgi:Lrp/AsnC family transcriptional regulator, leucine-responsive regulatory protein